MLSVISRAKNIATCLASTINKKKKIYIVLARQVAMFLAREMTDNSLPKIGKEFGGRDHSTVLHAYNKIKNMIGQDESLRIEIETIKNKIK
nr:helix-turn-helix domain-containing protein [Streptococcus equi]